MLTIPIQVQVTNCLSFSKPQIVAQLSSNRPSAGFNSPIKLPRKHFFGFFGIVPAPNLDENGDVARLAEAMEKGGKWE